MRLASMENYRTRLESITKCSEADHLLHEMLDDREIMQINAAELVHDLTGTADSRSSEAGNDTVRTQISDGKEHIRRFQLRN